MVHFQSTIDYEDYIEGRLILQKRQFRFFFLHTQRRFKCMPTRMEALILYDRTQGNWFLTSQGKESCNALYATKLSPHINVWSWDDLTSSFNFLAFNYTYYLPHSIYDLVLGTCKLERNTRNCSKTMQLAHLSLAPGTHHLQHGSVRTQPSSELDGPMRSLAHK